MFHLTTPEQHEIIYQFLEDYRCRNCARYNMKHGYCNRPGEPLVYREPNDFCNKAVRREDR